MSGPVYNVLRSFVHDSFGYDLKTGHRGKGHLADHASHLHNGVPAERHNVGGALLEKHMKTIILIVLVIYFFLIGLGIANVFLRDHFPAFADFVRVLMFLITALVIGFGIYIALNLDHQWFGQNRQNAIPLSIYFIMTGMGYLFVFQIARIADADYKMAVSDAVHDAHKITCDLALEQAQKKPDEQNAKCPLKTQSTKLERIRHALGQAVGVLFFVSFFVACVPLYFVCKNIIWDKMDDFLTPTVACAVFTFYLNLFILVFSTMHSSSSGWGSGFLLVKDLIVLINLEFFWPRPTAGFNWLNKNMNGVKLLGTPLVMFFKKVYIKFVT